MYASTAEQALGEITVCKHFTVHFTADMIHYFKDLRAHCTQPPPGGVDKDYSLEITGD